MFTSILISFVGKRAGVALAKVLPYALLALIIIGGGWLLFNNAYDSGVEDTELKYRTAMEEEKQRLDEANREAIEKAKQRQAELEKLLDEREATISELLEEGRADPDANRRAIGADSVRRLNRIR